VWRRGGFVGVVKISREVLVIYNDNGVPTLHGRGLGDVKQRIMDAFNKANEVHGVTGKVVPKPETENCRKLEEALTTKQKQTTYYGEKEVALFQKRADSLMIGAIRSPHVTLHVIRHEKSFFVGDLVKSYSADSVIAEALQDSKKNIRKAL
jgi:hypothetical protein